MENKITFDDIQKANESIKTTDIKGKDYAEVNQRIKAFRMIYPTGMIQTKMISNENGICIFEAMITDENGKLLATGTAYEKENSTFINKTSYIENCETSAVGRALSMAGFSIGTTIMSYQEIANATLQQELLEPISEIELKTLQGLIKQLEKDKKKISYEEILKQHNITDLKELNKQQYGYILLRFKDLSKE